MKKSLITMIAVCVFSLAFSANKPEKKIDRELNRIETEYKLNKDLNAAISKTAILAEKYGRESVAKRMLLLKSCLETCYNQWQNCKLTCFTTPGGHGIPGSPCYTNCDQQFYSCYYTGCGGVWGNKPISPTED